MKKGLATYIALGTLAAMNDQGWNIPEGYTAVKSKPKTDQVKKRKRKTIQTSKRKNRRKK